MKLWLFACMAIVEVVRSRVLGWMIGRKLLPSLPGWLEERSGLHGST